MNVSKHFMFACVLSTGMLGTLSSCNDDNDWSDVDKAAPVMELASEHIQTESGRKINIVGHITDADGIKTISLKCPAYLLNKTIDLVEIYGEPQKEYDLNYEYKIQQNMTAEEGELEVTITDIGNRQTSKTIKVSLDGDFTAPVFTSVPDKEIAVILKPTTAFTLAFSVRDNRVIDYVEVNVVDITNGEENATPVSGFPVKIEGQGNNRIDYSEKLTLPSVEAKLKATITAWDVAVQEDAHSSVRESIINVGPLPDMDAIYLCDVNSAEELNSDMFGVPVVMDHVGDYTYRVRYYNEKAGNQICFLGQKTDFGPICFGPDNANPSILGDDPEEVGRITLDKTGVYYLIEVNTYDRTWKLETYSPAEAINPVMHMTYGGWDLNTWWEWNNLGDIWWQEFYFGPADGPGNVTRMEVDPNNPNIYYVRDWAMEGGEGTNFIIHNWHSHGWWNLATWRVDDKKDPSKFMYYGNYQQDATSVGHYQSNVDYFNWKYINIPESEYKKQWPKAPYPFNMTSWGDEGYRKNFVPDNWVNAEIPKSAKYTFKIDIHAERGWMIPQE